MLAYAFLVTFRLIMIINVILIKQEVYNMTLHLKMSNDFVPIKISGIFGCLQIVSKIEFDC